ncbi:MAG TPA: CPBP family intramembrane glutamic endopeptidase [Nitrososphaeraceae archaeon]|nr:CPBP family intramembrane glutamic endopeptidase [Nitrososphaeraceae archaeon]
MKDFHPLRWTSKYRRTTVPYLIIMVLFYHAIGVLVLAAGSLLIQNVIRDYNEPSIPITIVSVLFAGPIEETLFFGIPLYATGSHIVVLAGGIIWAMIHILNTPTVQLNALAYTNWLFVIPSIFLSFRTWISGKGWFAVVSHSAWNIAFFTLGCTSGEFPCNVFYDKNGFSDIMMISIGSLLVALTYFLYRRNVTKLKYRYN